MSVRLPVYSIAAEGALDGVIFQTTGRAVSFSSVTLICSSV